MLSPSDSVALTLLPKAFLVGGMGLIVLRAIDSTTEVTIAVAAGRIVPIRASQVRSTGTTATGIVALA